MNIFIIPAGDSFIVNSQLSIVNSNKYQFLPMLSKADHHKVGLFPRIAPEKTCQLRFLSRLSHFTAMRVPADWKTWTRMMRPMTAAHMTRNLKL